MKNGFSLIELLVVVLILGILSSVALLQYNKSMQKARFANYVIWAKRIYDAEKLRFISHGSYSFNFAALNISVPEESSGVASAAVGNLILTMFCSVCLLKKGLYIVIIILTNPKRKNV